MNSIMNNKCLDIFYEITKIPRKSGEESKIADYLENFAHERNLECYRDKYNNVLIKKEKQNTKNNDVLILQAHSDMVCVKTEESKCDFQDNTIEIIKEGDVIRAKDTSLGADDGIGVAFILTILDSKDIKHPNLECLFTTEEETTFNGAINFDYSKLKGEKIVNFDHCQDNSLVIGCDGDIANEYILQGKFVENNFKQYKIRISNLKGGHSGIEINKNRANAIVMMAQILKELQNFSEICINDINGGTSAENIPEYCECQINTEIDIEIIKKQIDKYLSINTFVNENPKIEVEQVQKSERAFSIEDTKNLINEILIFEKGILTYRNNKIMTSESVGMISCKDNRINIKAILRSSDKKEIERYNKEKDIISEEYKFEKEEMYIDVIWLPKENSELKNKYKEAYIKVNNTIPKIEVGSHAVTECNVFFKNIPQADIISIGTIIENFHTVNERIYVSSCEKVLNTIIEFLKIFTD